MTSISAKLGAGFGGYGGHANGFINANREGLFSSIGMLSIYFAGLSLGVQTFKKRYVLSFDFNDLGFLTA